MSKTSKQAKEGHPVNQSVKKTASAGAIILISSASAALLTIISALVSLAVGDSLKLFLIIAVIVLPSTVSIWFLASMVTYTVGKFKGKISDWTDVNLRASSLIIGVILMSAVAALTVLTVYWGVDPISVITSVIKG